MIQNVVNKIEEELKFIFTELENWFMVNEDLLNYKPVDKGWTIKEVLEHISLTNYFLLILIKKGTVKAIALAKENDFEALLNNYDFNWKNMEQIGQHKSFEWNRPKHMEPTGNEDISVIKYRLSSQLKESLDYLHQLKNGEGILYRTMMTVNGLGKIDVYHYIYFLAQHAKRHVAQMEKNKKEFEQFK